MRGRAFPFKGQNNSGVYEGPAVIEGKLYRMMIWENKSVTGSPYLRIVFEPFEE